MVPTVRTAIRWTGEEILETGDYTLRHPGLLTLKERPEGWHLSRPPLGDVLVMLLDTPHVPAGYGPVKGRPNWFVYRKRIPSSVGLEDKIVYRVLSPEGMRMAQIRFLLTAGDDRMEEAVVAPIVASFRFRPHDPVK